MSLFITFEGLDFSGKSTQVRRLESAIRRGGRDVLVLREPGDTPIGESIRKILLDRSTLHLTPVAELFLFSASRAQLVEQVIRPALQRGTAVICDRFYDSTTAYQGAGRELDEDLIRSVNRGATGGLVPDVTLFLDVSEDDRHRRRVSMKSERDRMESNDESFYRRVRESFLRLATQEPRFHVIDGTRSEDEVAEAVWTLVHPLLQRHDRSS